MSDATTYAIGRREGVADICCQVGSSVRRQSVVDRRERDGMNGCLAEMSSAKVDMAERPTSLLPDESQHAPRASHILGFRSCDSFSTGRYV
jgi:hypothetical protein